MIPLSRLLLLSLCLPTCGCVQVATELVTQPLSYALRNHQDEGKTENEAIERCEKKHPGVPDECRKGDRECEDKVDAFNKCVDRQVKKLASEEDE